MMLQPQQGLGEFQLGQARGARAGLEPGSGILKPWPVLRPCTGVQAGRKGEEPKGNSKMTPSAGSLQLGIQSFRTSLVLEEGETEVKGDGNKTGLPKLVGRRPESAFQCHWEYAPIVSYRGNDLPSWVLVLLAL